MIGWNWVGARDNRTKSYAAMIRNTKKSTTPSRFLHTTSSGKMASSPEHTLVTHLSTMAAKVRATCGATSVMRSGGGTTAQDASMTWKAEKMRTWFFLS